MTKFRILTASIIALGLSFSAPVAANNFTVTTKLVKHDDLDLSSAKGQTSLERRIKSAVRAVCGNNTSRTLAETAIVMNCREQARADATHKAAVAIANYSDGPQLAARDNPIVGGN